MNDQHFQAMNHLLMRTIRSAAVVLGSMALSIAPWAQTMPLELRQEAIPLNWQSQRGAPLSPTNGIPTGSDGRGPSITSQSTNGLTINPATPRQFQGMVSLGALAVPLSPASLATNQSYGTRAANI